MRMMTEFGASPWSLLDNLSDLQNEFNRLFDQRGGGHAGAVYPPVNVALAEDEVLVDVDLPGVDPAEVNIAVKEDVLTITGTRKPALPEGAAYHKRERNFGDFSRSLQLPYRGQVDKINATYSKGVLRIHIPRAEEEKPRKIAIQAA